MKLILGNSQTGVSIARFLTNQGEPFVIYDDKDPIDLPAYDVVIKSPGVPLEHPLCKDKAVINELDLFKPKAKVIAVTGSNGKTTLATLIYEFLKYHQYEVALGGNIGIPVLDLPALSSKGFYVLELSSFQLETNPNFEIDLAILLNIVPNHLDRHGTMENYAAAKYNIFNHAKKGIVGQKLSYNFPIPVVQTTQNSHDILEALAEQLNLSKEGISVVLENFKGLEHRLEVVAKKGNTTFINDSKGTTFFAVGFAIDKVKDQGAIHLIMGGGLKEHDASYLESFLKQVDTLYIFGPNKSQFVSMLSPYKEAKTFDTLDEVFANLELNLETPSVVLLSPGATSYDLYKIYTERGDHFKRLVMAL